MRADGFFEVISAVKASDEILLAEDRFEVDDVTVNAGKNPTLFINFVTLLKSLLTFLFVFFCVFSTTVTPAINKKVKMSARNFEFCCHDVKEKNLPPLTPFTSPFNSSHF